jgi:hypothetical protein
MAIRKRRESMHGLTTPVIRKSQDAMSPRCIFSPSYPPSLLCERQSWRTLETVGRLSDRFGLLGDVLPLVRRETASHLSSVLQFWLSQHHYLCDKLGVSGMKTFEVRFRYQDRNEASVESTVQVEASSLPGAVGKAAREFVKGLDRKQRFDMNKNGLEITTKAVDKPTEAQGGTPT